MSIANEDSDENPYTFAIQGYGGRPFITTWKTDNAGTSNSTSITIPTTGTGYNYDVDWNNDGIFDEFGKTGSATHDYGTAGTYQVAIRGAFPRIYFNNGGDKSKLLNVNQWGDITWTSMVFAFYGCNNLNITSTDVPNLSSVTSLSSMFQNCSSLNGPANINSWNVSSVTSMGFLFTNASIFNQNIGSWNVANVTVMLNMFSGATNFNQDIGSWNVGLVTNMSGMFTSASAFNQNINSWNVANVTVFSGMFTSATSFNQPLNSWNVSHGLYMNSMFESATAFNQNIGSWNVATVSEMNNMFYGASAFNQNIGSWNVGAVTNMAYMFLYASAFNQSLAAWGTKFHANVNLADFLSNCGMNTANYDATLTGFNAGTVTSRSMGAIGRKYCAATTDRANLVLATASGGKGWTITGDINDNPTSPTGTSNPAICSNTTASLSASCTTGNPCLVQCKFGGNSIYGFALCYAKSNNGNHL